ncbi:MAG: ArsA family ATPase [Myxococcales bacterium]|nr:ArsA family ATPase [Myxococcales bacterium]
MLLCVGCGGVGKTTTCAALGLAAARSGKRVLCLTIDPARRLAESLGLERFKTEAQRIDAEVFAAADIDVEGSLTVMMLDTKGTFDSLVTALAATPEKRQRVLDNPLYQYISSSLAGTQEYMAMEKLYSVKDDPSYDLILLDTPPTSHALDFLDAPERLASAIDSAAVRWLLQATARTGKFSLNLLARTAASVLRGLGRITGGGFLDQVAGFLAEMNELFGSWKSRTEEVASALRRPDVAYVLVTSPDPLSIREVLFFANRLREQGMQPDAYVINRVHAPISDIPDAHAVVQAAHRHGLEMSGSLAERVIEAMKQEARLGELDRLHLIAIEEAFDEGLASPPVVRVPDFPLDIHDVRRLIWVANTLAPATVP